MQGVKCEDDNVEGEEGGVMHCETELGDEDDGDGPDENGVDTNGDRACCDGDVAAAAVAVITSLGRQRHSQAP